MGNRLSKIVTRTGDDGSTGLADGTRVAKDSPRIEAMGSIDELNCVLGVLLAQELPAPEARACLSEVQQDLFDLGGELATPGLGLITDGRIEWLEQRVEHFNAPLPPLREFVLPGGSRAAAFCHMARATCRRAERHCWALARTEPVGTPVLRYLNRLSDLLFVLTRSLARAESSPEVLWHRDRSGPGTPTGGS
jgi:cob(I)alamin adenosyltransferase